VYQDLKEKMIETTEVAEMRDLIQGLRVETIEVTEAVETIGQKKKEVKSLLNLEKSLMERKNLLKKMA
jgi:hypothetical protein